MERVLVLLSLIIIFTSCKRNCPGDCNTITIKGKVVDFSTKLGIPNVTLKTSLFTGQHSPYKNFDSVVSDRDGNFNYTVRPDDAYYENSNYFIRTYATVPNGYLSPAYILADAMSPTKGEPYLTRSPGELEFMMYKEVPLTIRLQRVGTETYQSIVLGIYYGGPGGKTVFSLIGANPSQQYTVTTGADIYTKVGLRKMYINRPAVDIVDSIKCSPNGNNSITLTY